MRTSSLSNSEIENIIDRLREEGSKANNANCALMLIAADALEEVENSRTHWALQCRQYVKNGYDALDRINMLEKRIVGMGGEL